MATARAAAYRERALVAAQALGVTDCLIVATLQLETADCLLNVLAEQSDDGAQRAALHATAVERFLAAAATLQRRRAAGTLLPGCCRVAEVNWRRRTSKHQDEADRTNSARMVGYGCFMKAACCAVVIIVRTAKYDFSPTPQLLQACWNVLADACALMVAPSLPNLVLGHEGEFA